MAIDTPFEGMFAKSVDMQSLDGLTVLNGVAKRPGPLGNHADGPTFGA
ncbi:hypothetical protein [Streptomyces sp. NPDC057702]